MLEKLELALLQLLGHGSECVSLDQELKLPHKCFAKVCNLICPDQTAY